MKMIKMALLAGSAVAVSAAAAHADDLDALKAQIETLNARVAAMETAPAVPAGYQLVAISEGARVNTPGLEVTARERNAYGDKATYISVLPTADAPAGATITWSGYARAGLVYSNSDVSGSIKHYTWNETDEKWDKDAQYTAKTGWDENNDIDVKARGQLRVTASTDTAVGEVGVDIRLRGNFNGNGAADVYSDVAWGYWAMTPELTFGGGYAGSLGNIGYGYDGACTCYYTDNSGVDFDPGDTTQMRLSYGSGPFSMAVALEDASKRAGGNDYGATDAINVDRLGAAGEIKYSGDTFSGEISGVWRDVNSDEYGTTVIVGEDEDKVYFAGQADALWQIGAGLGFSLGDIASLSLAAAMGEGPSTNVFEGEITGALPFNNNWWGVTALASFNLTDAVHAEVGAGYKTRDFDNIDSDFYETAGDRGNIDALTGVGSDTWSVLAGLYYNPVDQLTIGLEGEWYQTNTSATLTHYEADVDADILPATDKYKLDRDSNNFSVDLVSVWRF